MSSRNVLITGTIRFDDGTKPVPLADDGPPGAPGGPPQSLFEYGGLHIQVTTGSVPSKHRAVVSSEGRFGFRVPVPDEETSITRVEATKDGYQPLILESLPIGTAPDPIGPVADTGDLHLRPLTPAPAPGP